MPSATARRIQPDSRPSASSSALCRHTHSASFGHLACRALPMDPGHRAMATGACWRSRASGPRNGPTLSVERPNEAERNRPIASQNSEAIALKYLAALAWRPNPIVPTNTLLSPPLPFPSLPFPIPSSLHAATHRLSAVPRRHRHHHHPAAAAMDLFPDGAHVRLRSGTRDRESGIQMLLCADLDWEGIYAIPVQGTFASQGTVLSTVWRVRHRMMNGDNFLLLQGAAFGRYLAVSSSPPPPPLRGRAAVQRTFDNSHGVEALLWRPLRVHGHSKQIRLHHFRGHLQANRRSSTYMVTVNPSFTDTHRRMTRWVVEAVALVPGLSPRMLVSSIANLSS